VIASDTELFSASYGINSKNQNRLEVLVTLVSYPYMIVKAVVKNIMYKSVFLYYYVDIVCGNC